MRQTSEVQAAIAVTRFGLGAIPGEIAAVANDPKGWLTAQISTSGAPQPTGDLPSTRAQLAAFQAYQGDRRARRRDRRESAPDVAAMTEGQTMDGTMGGQEAMAPATRRAAQDGDARTPEAQARFDAARMGRRDLRQDVGVEFLARAQHGAATDAGFAERWALFWANSFAVSATKFQSGIFAGPYEREAIRPNVFGRFEDLVLAAEKHPAMLTYLDQAQSVGPNSRAGQRRERGLNENLAREAMELHTLGADGGYAQADVTELARALTGWAIPLPRGAQSGTSFAFRPQVHEPGARTVLGKSYAEGGVAQGEAILRDLANHPVTAKRQARRIATHFVADAPPQGLVDALETAWRDSGGDLAVVARALVEAPDAWAETPTKFKTPYEFMVSTHRALGTQPQRPQAVQGPLRDMGQPAFSPASPEGWPDTAADWAGPDAVVKRFEWAKQVGARTGQADPVTTAASALGPRIGERTRQTVARAESRAEGMTLFLMSPEFQRR